MTRSILTILYAFVTTLFCSCKGVQAVSLSGEAIQRVTKFWKADSVKADTSFTVLLGNAWFKDGIGITQRRGTLTTYSDSVQNPIALIN